MRQDDKGANGDERAAPEAVYQYLMDHRDEIMAAAKEKAKELIAKRDKRKQRRGPREPK